MSKCRFFWLINFLWVSIIGTLLHFVFEWSGENSFVGLFSPVNESIWEHMKLLFFPAAVLALFLYPFFRREYPAFLTCCSFAILSAMVMQTSIYYIYSGIIGKDIPIVNIMLFYLCAALDSSILCALLKKRSKEGSLWGLAIFCGISICFFYFTKNPPDLGVFYDPLENISSYIANSYHTIFI